MPQPTFNPDEPFVEESAAPRFDTSKSFTIEAEAPRFDPAKSFTVDEPAVPLSKESSLSPVLSTAGFESQQQPLANTSEQLIQSQADLGGKAATELSVSRMSETEWDEAIQRATEAFKGAPLETWQMAGGAMEVAGTIARAIPADIAFTLSRNFQNVFKDDKGAGNLLAALNGKPLPIDEVISDAATYAHQLGEFPTAAAVGQVSQDLTATAPLLLGFGVLPKPAQIVVGLYFTQKMLRDAPETFRALGDEMGKPKEQQDPTKIAQLVSAGAQEIGFSAAGLFHGTKMVKSGAKRFLEPNEQLNVRSMIETPEEAQQRGALIGQMNERQVAPGVGGEMERLRTEAATGSPEAVEAFQKVEAQNKANQGIEAMRSELAAQTIAEVAPVETIKPEKGLPENATVSDLMADMTEAGRKAFAEAKSKPDEFTAVDVTDLSNADRINLARLGLSFSEDRRRRIMATYPIRMRVEDLRNKVSPQKPAELAAETKAKPVNPSKTKAAQRPPDIIDIIKDNFGTIKTKSASKPGTEDYYGESYRRISKAQNNLFSPSGQSWDVLLTQLQAEGYVPKDFTVDDLQTRIEQANSYRSTYKSGQTPEQQQGKFGNLLTRKADVKSAEQVNAGELGIGDKFTIEGNEFEVTNIDLETNEVQFKDGTKYGRPIVGDVQTIHVDKGSFVKASEAVEQFPTKEELKLAQAESIAEQNARLAQEETARQQRESETKRQEAEATKIREMKERATQRTGGNLGSAGQGGLFVEPGQQEIFRPKPPELQSLGGALASEDLSAPGSVVSNMFAAIDRDRVAMGKEPMPPTRTRTWDQDNQIALAKMNREPDWIPNLLAEVKERPRPLLSWENAGVVWHRAKLKAEHNNALARIAQSFDDKRVEDLSAAKSDAQIYENALQSLDETVGRSGTGSEAGRTLQAQKMGAGDDFTLIEMRLRKRKAVGGRQLTDTETAEIAKLHADYAAKTKAFEAREAELRQELVDSEIKRAFAESQKAVEPHVKIIADKVKNYFDNRADAALKRLQGKVFTIGPEMLADLIDLGVSRILGGAARFAEWSAKMLTDLDKSVEPHLKNIFDEAQKALDAHLARNYRATKPEVIAKVKRTVRKLDPTEKRESATDKIAAKVEKGEQNEIFNHVQQLVRALVEENPKITREPLIDAVHDILKDFIPAITRLETMDAISGRGRFTLPRQDEVSKTVSDLKTQTRLVGHQIDVEARRPLPRTGFQPGKMSDLARREEQKLNELKRRFGVTVTDPTAQLASVLTARKTYYRNRIADLTSEIKAREKIVKSKSPSPTDTELESLKTELATIKEEHAQIFTKPGLTDAQRLERSKSATDRQIADLEKQLKTGRIFPEGKKPKGQTDPELEAKEARLEALKAEREWARGTVQAKDVDHVMQALTSRKAAMTRQIADLTEKIAAGDFTRAKKTPLDISQDPRALMLKGQLEKLRSEFQRGLQLDEMKNRTKLQKIWSGIKQTKNAYVNITSSFDFSAPRQAFAAILANATRIITQPGLIGRPLQRMFQAWAREDSARSVEQRIKARKNRENGADNIAGIEYTELNTTHFTRHEENAHSILDDWAELPIKTGSTSKTIITAPAKALARGVRMSNRAFISFLNVSKAGLFDHLLEVNFRDRPPTEVELQVIGNLVNVSHGRGKLNPMFAKVASEVMWSPKLFFSRIQVLLGQPLWGGGPLAGSGRARKIVAKEYVRWILSGTALSAISQLFDEKQPAEMTSSDVGKIVRGNTRIDLWEGFQQPVVLAARIVEGKTTSIDGTTRDIDKYGTGEVIWNFFKNKARPDIVAAVKVSIAATDVFKDSKDVRVTPAEAAKGLIPVPLAVREVIQVMKEQGMTEGAIIQALSQFGAGISNYEDREAQK